MNPGLPCLPGLSVHGSARSSNRRLTGATGRPSGGRCVAGLLEQVPHLEQFRQSSSAHVTSRRARNAPCVGFAQGLMADTVRQMSSAASQVTLPRSVIMGRNRPLAAAPDNASGNDLRANRAESDLVIT